MTNNDRTPAIDRLREIVPADATLYTILRKVSPSGMSRNISVVYIDRDGEPRTLDGLVLAAGIGQRPRNGGDGVQMRGAGMDMGFALVYDLAWKLYGDGYTFRHRWL